MVTFQATGQRITGTSAQMVGSETSLSAGSDDNTPHEVKRASASGEAGDSAALSQARIDLQASRAALTESLEAAAFLHSILNASSDCIKVLTFDGDLIFMNEGGKSIMEIDDFDAFRGCAWSGFWEGEGKLAAEAALDAARAGRVGHFQGSASTAKGTKKHWDVTVTLIPGRDGHEGNILSISRDITVASELEKQKALLSRELGHRIKNSLSVVQAIAMQTFRGGDPAKLRDFNARLGALGAAQDLLLQTVWEQVSVRELVERTLSPMCPPERLSLDIGDLRVDGRKGLSLALAIHELGTNALKYGALSNDDGTVLVKAGAGGGQFHFVWREIDGPVVSPPTHTGFGTRLMTRNLEADFGGAVELNFSPTGVVLSLSAPQ